MASSLDLLSALGSVASIASLVEQHVRWMSGPQERSGFERKLPPVMAAALPNQIVRASQSIAAGEAAKDAPKVDLSAMSSPAVQALVDRLKRSEEAAAKKLAGPSYSLAELQELVDELKAEVCAVLLMIKQINGGKLPGQPLYDKWTRFSCG